MREIIGLLDYEIIESLLRKKIVLLFFFFNFLAEILAALFLVFVDGSCCFMSHGFIITCELHPVFTCAHRTVVGKRCALELQ
jgi:hypothetical protein